MTHKDHKLCLENENDNKQKEKLEPPVELQDYLLFQFGFNGKADR